MTRTQRTIRITLDSALTLAQWADFYIELDMFVTAMACDYAAACEDDTYELRVQGDRDQ